eukprot:jgi/Tetstr1/455844/TSEL_042635.t2
MLVSAPVLRHPDWRRPFVLHTDWSPAGVGACLSQVDDKRVEYAVSFASRMNTPEEADLSSYEEEVGAVVWAVQRFRYYMYGNHFQLIIDCKAMEWLRTTARLRGKLARWSLILAEYDFSIKHRPGKDNTVPHLLSRRPMPAEPVRATSDAAGTATAIATQRRSPVAMADASAMFGGCVYASQKLHWPTRDVWSSPVAISYLRGKTTPADVSVEVWQQLVRRCAKYSWHNDKVWLHTGDTARETSAPWSSSGRACDRVKASFNQKYDRLEPMPLFRLFYRFSVDSAGPLPTSSEGHKYVIVIVEHFSKWIELVHVRDLEASTTAKAFHERVLARYGAPVEVVTDNGTEYQGAFREHLERHGIQPVDIPPGHPQANGMAERNVQVLKVALRKVVPTLGTASWHSWMPVIEFGYRVSKQATTGYSPYFLLFGRDHEAPDQVRALLEEPVDMDNDIAVINLITQRADMLRAAMPKAFERALQAQHRDVVRYRKVRRGDVQPRRHRFEIGSYVYVAQPPLNTLDVRTARTILRVVEILESDGNEIQVHMDNCAPCHLSNLVPARTREDESSLAKCVLIWADRGLALSKRAVKKHALDIIKSRGYDKDPVAKIWIKRGKMSRKWFRGFMRRHPELPLQAAAGGQPEPKLPKKVRPSTLQRAGAALETAAKAEENKEQQVNKAEEEVANAKCRKTELAEAVAEAELSVLGAHVKVADAKIAAWQDSSARERQEARDEMSVFDSSDSEEGEDEIGEEEKEDGEQGEDELNPAYIDQDDEWLNW